MYVINVDNVNQALPQGLRWLANGMGQTEDSRNGPVRVSPSPVMTVYRRPDQRVLFSPLRDANPFFHFFESLWMLAGRNDLAFITQFNKQMVAYSDDGGITQPAAYGFRWREHFGYDQLAFIIDELKANPTTRRCVLAMWDGGSYYKVADSDEHHHSVDHPGDLAQAISGSKDVPCNTHCYFRINAGVLDMTVLCRSNDIIWGAYGANAVHFSFLMEYVAQCVGVPMGKMYQLSNNFHYYTEVAGDYDRAMLVAYDCERTNEYANKLLTTVPLIQGDVAVFDRELHTFLDMPDHPEPTYGAPILQDVAVPMYAAWQAFKAKRYLDADNCARGIIADDWREACTAWLARRELNRRKKEAGK